MNLETCVLRSMDGEDLRLFPFLPELLADLKELGADPRLIEELLSGAGALPGHASQVLDLGCGKGAVSIRLAGRTGSRCLGLDAVPAFVEAARAACAAQGFADRCRFEVAAIITRPDVVVKILDHIRSWDPPDRDPPATHASQSGDGTSSSRGPFLDDLPWGKSGD